MEIWITFDTEKMAYRIELPGPYSTTYCEQKKDVRKFLTEYINVMNLERARINAFNGR